VYSDITRHPYPVHWCPLKGQKQKCDVNKSVPRVNAGRGLDSARQGRYLGASGVGWCGEEPPAGGLCAECASFIVVQWFLMTHIGNSLKLLELGLDLPTKSSTVWVSGVWGWFAFVDLGALQSQESESPCVLRVSCSCSSPCLRSERNAPFSLALKCYALILSKCTDYTLLKFKGAILNCRLGPGWFWSLWSIIHTCVSPAWQNENVIPLKSRVCWHFNLLVDLCILLVATSFITRQRKNTNWSIILEYLLIFVLTDIDNIKNIYMISL
jgi:hypothetical protein